ncbi:MAG: Phage-related protein [uncultured Clostridium sp.]
MSWIEFNNMNSDEVFGEELLITKRTIGTPETKKYTVEIPFSSNTIDYSFINGLVFNNRTIELEINIGLNDRAYLYKIYSKILSWLLKPGYSKLKLSDVEGYFIAKVESISNLEEISILGNLKIKFLCYPWRIEEEVEHTVILNKNNTISLMNSLMPSTPIIKVSNVCNIEYNNKIYTLVKGDNKNFDIVFKEGINTIKLLTDGPIEMTIKYKRGVL